MPGLVEGGKRGTSMETLRESIPLHTTPTYPTQSGRTPGRVIEKIDLPKTGGDPRPAGITGATLAQWLDEKEKQFIAQKLEDCGGSIALTARSCDIGLRSLYRKMQKYGLDKKRFKHNGASRKAIAIKNQRPVAEAEQLDPDPPRVSSARET
jgi:hypothetical protein